MRLYMIRHAQSENNALWDRTGSNKNRSQDPELSEIGRKQAQMVASYIAQKRSQADDSFPKQDNFQITHIYCSLMVRAIETGNQIAEALGMPLYGLLDAHENGGIYMEDPETGIKQGLAGKTKAELEARFPRLVVPEGTEEGWWRRPFETVEQRPARAERMYRFITERHGGTEDQVILITHGGFFNSFLNQLLKADASHPVWFLLNNTAINRFDFIEDYVELNYLNRTQHLTNDFLT